jgi:hypothetical protein
MLLGLCLQASAAYRIISDKSGNGSQNKFDNSLLHYNPAIMKRVLFGIYLLIFSPFISKSQQINDSSFNTIVAQPAYKNVHPRALIDAGHYNLFSTVTSRIEPLTELLEADGYDVHTTPMKFSKSLLSNNQILIILTARGGSTESDSTYFSAFTDSEIDVLYNWIKDGGSLLFGFDHSPYNYAAEKLLKRLGVEISFGVVEDSVQSEAGIEKGPDSRKETLVFSQTNGLLGNHPIITGRNSDELIKKIAISSSQSLKPPRRSSVLCKLSLTAYNAGAGSSTSYCVPVRSYNATAIAFTLGDGRVVITADCSMWTAQLVSLNDHWVEFGMARKDLDNRQFALNVMHWLSHLLKE